MQTQTITASRKKLKSHAKSLSPTPKNTLFLQVSLSIAIPKHHIPIVDLYSSPGRPFEKKHEGFHLDPQQKWSVPWSAIGTRWPMPKALLLSETLVFFSAPNGIIDALERSIAQQCSGPGASSWCRLQTWTNIRLNGLCTTIYIYI